MLGWSFVTTGQMSGSGGDWMTAICVVAVAVCALQLPAVTAPNVPARNVRRFIMPKLLIGPNPQAT
jgi:hypothetical protein